jgi:hypothetical protein
VCAGGLWGWALFYADDLALELFVLRGFDLCLVLVDLVVDLAADDEFGGVHRFFVIRAAGVAVAFGVEGEVVGLMLVLFVCGSEGLEVFEGGGAVDLIGGCGERRGDGCEGEDRSFGFSVHGFTSKEDCRRRERPRGLAVLIETESQCCRRTGSAL